MRREESERGSLSLRNRHTFIYALVKARLGGVGYGEELLLYYSEF